MKQDQTQSLELCLYQPDNHIDILKFSLPSEQEPFTSHPCKALEACQRDRNKYPVVILSNQVPVGFFVLDNGEDRKKFTSNRDAILLRAFSIDYKQQRKGYAKDSLLLLPEFVKEHFPHANEIVLAVNERNLAAKHVYSRAGFVDNGMRREGPLGMQSILQYQLEGR